MRKLAENNTTFIYSYTIEIIMNRKTGAIILLLILSAVILSGCVGQRPEGTPVANVTATVTPTATLSYQVSPEEQSCINARGNVSTALCCLSVGDFPNTCLIGGCGCSPQNSHEVKTCDCGVDKCFNGTTCVARGL